MGGFVPSLWVDVMVFIFAGNRGHGEEEAKDALLTFF
jgi:hypothetical protein